jgi:cytochrome c5
MLKPMLSVSAVILCLFTPTSGSMPQGSAQAQSTAATRAAAKVNAETLAKAKKLYEIDCAMCHGDNGNGQTDLAKDMKLKLSDWTDEKSLAGKSDDELFKSIRNGKDKMPPEAEGRAKDDEVKAIIAFIRDMSKGQPQPAPAPAPDAAAPAPAPAPDAKPNH